MSLRREILFGIIAIYSLTLGILATLVSLDLAARERADREQRRREAREKNELLVQLVRGLISEQMGELDQVRIRELLDWETWDLVDNPVLLTVERGEETFINPAGVPAADRSLDSERIRALITRAIEERRIISGEDYNYVAASLDPGVTGWGVYFEPPVSTTEYRPLVDARLLAILMAVGIPLITLVTYGLLTRVVIRPIERLQTANRRVAAGDYAAELPQTGRNDEIDELIRAFNSMLRDVRDYHHNLEERVREATEKIRRTERRLITAQRLAATGKLAAGIGHEINNPLGGMINIARNLMRREHDAAKQREYLELILEGLERIQSTVRKMLPLQIREVQPQVVDLRKVLRQARELVRYRTEQAGIRVSLELGAEPLPVFGDPHELHQVYLNILINSVDAIGSDGEIRLRAHREDGWIETFVKDTGCGMTEHQIQDAFDLFYTTKEAGEGSGLGLSIVHNIVDNHGGAVTIRSRPGEGTSVEIRFPVAPS